MEETNHNDELELVPDNGGGIPAVRAADLVEDDADIDPGRTPQDEAILADDSYESIIGSSGTRSDAAGTRRTEHRNGR
jgi:hypothetical protein